MYSNCLFWALRQEAKHGGFIKSRRSERGWWRHWMWSPDGKEWWGFEPVPKWDFSWLPLPPPIFKGRPIKEED